MKHYRHLLLLIIVMLLISSSVYAEGKKGWAILALTGGGYTFDNQPGLTDEPLYGVKVGYEINGNDLRKRLAIEAVYQSIDGHVDAQDADVDVTLLRLDVLYFMNPFKKLMNITPYFSIGAGGQFISGDLGSSSEPLAAYGVGLRLPITDSLSLRADARHLLIFADEQRDEFEYTAGLQYTFGKPKKIKKKKIIEVDTDKDGIKDPEDQCPGTPEGIKVNRTGCPVNPPDTDKDGVADYLDKCSATESGYPVDNDGCLLDTDKDGVADPFDKCPNNPPGFKVNDDGCMEISQ